MRYAIRERLKQFIDSQNISIREFERRTNLSNGYVASIKYSIHPNKLSNIVLQFPNLNRGWLLTGEGEMLRDAGISDKVPNSIPMYEDVSSIGGTNSVSASLDGVMPSSRYIDAGDWFKGATAAIRHYGDSMREYPSGCIIVIKEVRDISQVVWGRNYCIETEEFRITKKLQRGSDSSVVTAYSTNTDTYPDGHLIHEPVTIPVKKIRRLFLVMGCVIKEQSSGPIYIENDIQ